MHTDRGAFTVYTELEGMNSSANKYLIFVINLAGFKETCFMLTLRGIFLLDWYKKSHTKEVFLLCRGGPRIKLLDYAEENQFWNWWPHEQRKQRKVEVVFPLPSLDRLIKVCRDTPHSIQERESCRVFSAVSLDMRATIWYNRPEVHQGGSEVWYHSFAYDTKSAGDTKLVWKVRMLKFNMDWMNAEGVIVSSRSYSLFLKLTLVW